MIITRNPVEYMRRKGLVEEPAQPKPRLDVRALLVNTIPIADPPYPVANVLKDFEGVPPPDRGGTRPWPGQTE